MRAILSKRTINRLNVIWIQLNMLCKQYHRIFISFAVILTLFMLVIVGSVYLLPRNDSSPPEINAYWKPPKFYGRNSFNEQVTVVVKAFERPECLLRLLQGVRKLYPTSRS